MLDARFAASGAPGGAGADDVVGLILQRHDVVEEAVGAGATDAVDVHLAAATRA